METRGRKATGKLREPERLGQARAEAGKRARGCRTLADETRDVNGHSREPLPDRRRRSPRRQPGSATSPQASAPALPVRLSEVEGTWSAKLPALPAAASAPRLRDPRPQSVRPGAGQEPEPPPLTHRGAPSRVPDARPTLTAAAPSAGWSSPPPSPTAGPRTPSRAAAAAATSPAATATTAPAADATLRPGLAPHASRLTPSGARLLESSPLALALGRRSQLLRRRNQNRLRGWARFALFLHEASVRGQGPQVPVVRVGPNSAIGPTKKKNP